MSGTARHTKEMIEQAKKKLAASTDPVDKVLHRDWNQVASSFRRYFNF